MTCLVIYFIVRIRREYKYDFFRFLLFVLILLFLKGREGILVF